MFVKSASVQPFVALLVVAITLLGGERLQAQQPVTCDAKCAAIVFGDSGKTLSAAEQEQIAAVLQFKVAPDGKTLVDAMCEEASHVSAMGGPDMASARDLNGDGTLEVFLLGGNSCLSGSAGATVSLFIKDASGKYQPHLGFPAGSYEVLETSNQGFPDLMFGGPGFCFPVWRWNGTTYDFFRNQEQEPGGCEGVGP